MRRYIKDNKNIFKLINSDKYKIISIKPIIKKKYNGLCKINTITSYCIKYEKML